MHLWNIFAKGRGRNFPAFTLSLLTILSSLFFPPSASVCQDAYTVISVENGGSISGTVCLKAAANIGTMTITQDKKQCGKMKRSPRLVVSNDLGVANAIVFIEDIKSGKSFERQPSYVLAQKNCEFLPHISLIPLGERLEIVNHDAVLHNVHAYDSNVEPKTIFNLAQPVKNLRTKTRQMLNPRDHQPPMRRRARMDVGVAHGHRASLLYNHSHRWYIPTQRRTSRHVSAPDVARRCRHPRSPVRTWQRDEIPIRGCIHRFPVGNNSASHKLGSRFRVGPEITTSRGFTSHSPRSNFFPAVDIHDWIPYN